MGLVEDHRPQEAVASFQQAIALRSDYAIAHLAYVEALLTMG